MGTEREDSGWKGRAQNSVDDVAGNLLMTEITGE